MDGVMSKWHNIKDERPEHEERVLVTDDGYIELKTYDEVSQCWDDSDGDDYDRPLEWWPYWMRLPEFMKE
jgi:hypothetical protein